MKKKKKIGFTHRESRRERERERESKIKKIEEEEDCCQSGLWEHSHPVS